MEPPRQPGAATSVQAANAFLNFWGAQLPGPVLCYKRLLRSPPPIAQGGSMSEQSPAAPPPPPEDRLVQTQHHVTVDGQPLSYTVTTGTLVIREEAEKSGEGTSEGEKARATIFFVAYTRDDVGDWAARPLTFSFNGGPGSSSVWLHLGAARAAPGRDGRRWARSAAALPPGRQRRLAARPTPTWSSSTRSAPGSAARCRARRRSSSTASRRTSSRSATSSGCTPPATGAGSRPSS